MSVGTNYGIKVILSCIWAGVCLFIFVWLTRGTLEQVPLWASLLAVIPVLLVTAIWLIIQTTPTK